MPRAPRIIIPETPHHITQRGNNSQTIFLDDNDRSKYLSILKERSDLYDLQIQGYCLMINHIHIVATPASISSLPKCIGNTHRQYSQYFNKKYEKNGHLWHSRFYSCPLDDTHFIHALIYVDRNPVQAGMVEYPWDYQWSSAAAHLGRADSAKLLNTISWNKLAVKIDWKTIIDQAVDPEIAENIRKHTESGHPLGSENFLKELEEKVGFSVQKRPKGRPGKK